jgi:hypothetical protein
MTRAIAATVTVVIGRSDHIGQVPMFRADPSWPKIPNNWQFDKSQA